MLLQAICTALLSLAQSQPPNVILVMTDDQGWGDVGFHGHQVLQTPHLDEMAAAGVRFERFYAAAPVCSPTRGSCLTGRHPYRYGVHGANTGHLPEDEFNLAAYLQSRGYRTGHFGKWHLGTLTTTERDSNRGGPKNVAHFAPPWQRGFDVCFSTEAKVPTLDPMVTPPKVARGTGNKKPGTPYGTYYWNELGEKIPATELQGDDSELIMNQALKFVRTSVEQKQPFFTVVWFHAPHYPVLAGDKHKQIYRDMDQEFSEFELNYYGALTSVDEQVGRLRTELRRLGIADDTMLWFCSDNGPEGQAGESPGTAAHLRGRKRDLLEGGVRVPGVMEWPQRFTSPQVVHTPCSTLDYVPTVLAALAGSGAPQFDELNQNYIGGQDVLFDGINLLPILNGERQHRGRAIGFESGKQAAWIEDRWKLYSNQANQRGGAYHLYDLIADPSEANDVSKAHADVVARMKSELEAWRSAADLDWREEDARPNIILIMADDLGKEWLSCYGGEEMQTPNLDRLAADGVRFENAYSMPVCTPTRTTLLTGQYPFRHGWVNHWDVPRWGKGCHFDPQQNFSVARVLRSAGYATAIAGKWQINDFRLQPDVLREHGFNDWCVWTGYEDGNLPSDKRYWDPYLHTPNGSRTHEGAYGNDVFREFALDFLRQNRHRPNFVYLPLCLPHTPFATTPAQPEADGKLQKYHAMVAYVDQFVGELRGGIDELGLKQQTVVIFTTDNGSTRGMTAEQNGRLVQGGKNRLTQSGCNVPFMVYAPGYPLHDKVSHSLIDFTDFFPTLLDIADADAPAKLDLDGQSFFGVMRGDADFKGRDWVMSMGGGSPAQFRDGRVRSLAPFADRIVRDQDYKLWIQKGVATRLYHLGDDPGEQQNLILSTDPHHAAARRRLQAIVNSMPTMDASPRYQPIESIEKRPAGD